MPNDMDLEKFQTQIKKTGFPLEFQITQQLKNIGWTTISNKYYVDDLEETVREIDAIAYRVSKVEGIDIYTVLILSCKKSDSNVWAFLSREANLKDPNADWWPLHAWTNEKILQYHLAQPGCARDYHAQMEALGVREALAIPQVEVFAFQEMDKGSGSPQNDKPIFSSITSLMKAQAYELSALAERKKSPALYQFNLIAVVEADLIRLNFSAGGISASNVDSENYVARYIIGKKQTFSRIRFIDAENFESALADYGNLHAANCKWFGEAHRQFYATVVVDDKKSQYLLKDFDSMLSFWINYYAERNFGKKTKIKITDLKWREGEGVLAISTWADDNELQFLNRNIDIEKHVTRALKKVYRYEGSYKFVEDDIPF